MIVVDLLQILQTFRLVLAKNIAACTGLIFTLTPIRRITPQNKRFKKIKKTGEVRSGSHYIKEKLKNPELCFCHKLVYDSLSKVGSLAKGPSIWVNV